MDIDSQKKTPTASNNLPPSLDLSFDWLKDLLNNQSKHANILESKASNLFNSATVILGIGLSAGALSLTGFDLQSIIYGTLSLISYGFVAGYTLDAIKLHRYETLDNPIIIRQYYWDMSPSQFKIELLTHMEDSYTKNEKVLTAKTNAIRFQILATLGEVMFIIALLVYGLAT